MKKRYIFAPVFVLGGWALFVAFSLWRVGDSFDGLPSLDSQDTEGLRVGASPQSPEIATLSAIDTEPAISGAVSPLENESVAIASGGLQTSSGMWSSVPQETLCRYLRLSGFVSVLMDDTEVSLPFGFHMSLSDNTLRARADTDEDGLAQYVYAHRILDLELVPGHVFLEPEIVSDRFDSVDDDDFQLVTQYLISAVRNKNWGAARRLASIYFPFDKIESHAWLLIDEMAGGNGLQIGPSQGPDAKTTIVQHLADLTEEERDSSFARASELVTEFELIDGLLPPDECLEAPKP